MHGTHVQVKIQYLWLHGYELGTVCQLSWLQLEVHLSTDPAQNVWKRETIKNHGITDNLFMIGRMFVDQARIASGQS